jgi:hypothetical protein
MWSRTLFLDGTGDLVVEPLSDWLVSVGGKMSGALSCATFVGKAVYALGSKRNHS